MRIFFFFLENYRKELYDVRPFRASQRLYNGLEYGFESVQCIAYTVFVNNSELLPPVYICQVTCMAPFQ